MTKQTGRLTLPTDADIVEETKELELICLPVLLQYLPM